MAQGAEIPSRNASTSHRDAVASVLLVALCLLVLYWAKSRETALAPKLAGFGLVDFSIVCEGEARVYRLVSTNPPDAQRNRSIHSRSLGLGDHAGAVLYSTMLFDGDALDAEGVWRFHHRRTADTRLLARKDPGAVLYGDEQRFDIAEDFVSMVVETSTGPVYTTCRPQARHPRR